MSAIATADIHQNEKASDEYRWSLFDWLLEQEADELLILGDLTDAKDRHSAKLVNRLYRACMKLQEKFKVIILKGNHDYFDPKHPFFEFIGNQSDIVFVQEPQIIELSIGKATFIPAGVNWNFKLHKFPYLFTHATFSGSKAENGQTMTGVDPHVLDHYEGICYSGDIHKPQRMLGGKIVYVGAPYHVRFGDNYTPRVLKLHNDGERENLYFPAPRKLTLSISKPSDIADIPGKELPDEGDFVKVRCHLRRVDYVKWKAYREEIRAIAVEEGWRLHGISPVPVDIQPAKEDKADFAEHKSPTQLVEEYAKGRKGSAEHIRIGKELLA